MFVENIRLSKWIDYNNSVDLVHIMITWNNEGTGFEVIMV